MNLVMKEIAFKSAQFLTYGGNLSFLRFLLLPPLLKITSLCFV